MRASSLLDKKVQTTAGRRLGRVVELEIERSTATFLVCGKNRILERLGCKRESGYRIPWSAVERIDDDLIIVRETGIPPATTAVESAP